MMTMENYKQIKADAKKAMDDAKKQYDAIVAEQEKIIKDAQQQLSRDNAKFNIGDKVLKGTGSTIYVVSHRKVVITGDSLGYFYDITPTNGRLRNTVSGVYEKDLKKIEENA